MRLGAVPVFGLGGIFGVLILPVIFILSQLARSRSFASFHLFGILLYLPDVPFPAFVLPFPLLSKNSGGGLRTHHFPFSDLSHFQAYSSSLTRLFRPYRKGAFMPHI